MRIITETSSISSVVAEERKSDFPNTITRHSFDGGELPKET